MFNECVSIGADIRTQKLALADEKKAALPDAPARAAIESGGIRKLLVAHLRDACDSKRFYSLNRTFVERHMLALQDVMKPPPVRQTAALTGAIEDVYL